MILTNMFYLEEMNRTHWAFQITATVRILLELMFCIKYWKTSNENYSCKMYIEEVSANIGVESGKSGKKMLAVDFQVILPSGLCGREGKIHPRTLSAFYRMITCCSLGAFLYVGCVWYMPLVFLWLRTWECMPLWDMNSCKISHQQWKSSNIKQMSYDKYILRWHAKTWGRQALV